MGTHDPQLCLVLHMHAVFSIIQTVDMWSRSHNSKHHLRGRVSLQCVGKGMQQWPRENAKIFCMVAFSGISSVSVTIIQGSRSLLMEDAAVYLGTPTDSTSFLRHMTLQMRLFGLNLLPFYDFIIHVISILTQRIHGVLFPKWDYTQEMIGNLTNHLNAYWMNKHLLLRRLLRWSQVHATHNHARSNMSIRLCAQENGAWCEKVKPPPCRVVREGLSFQWTWFGALHSSLSLREFEGPPRPTVSPLVVRAL